MHCSDVGSGIRLVCFDTLFGEANLAVKETARRSFSLRIPNLDFSHLLAFNFRPTLAPALLEQQPAHTLEKWGLRKRVKRHVYSLFSAPP